MKTTKLKLPRPVDNYYYTQFPDGMLGTAYKIRFNGEIYYGIEDFMLRANIENFEIRCRRTNELISPHKYFWTQFKNRLQESHDEFLFQTYLQAKEALEEENKKDENDKS